MGNGEVRRIIYSLEKSNADYSVHSAIPPLTILITQC